MARKIRKGKEELQSEDLLQAAEHESEFMLKVEEGTVEVDIHQLKKLHRDELLEILDFVDEEKEPALYAAVSEALRLHTQPRIQVARIDERVWSYFYDKYILRLLLLIWLAVVILIIKPLLPRAINTELSPVVLVALVGALLLVLLWRIFLALVEMREPVGKAGSSPVRRKLGLRVVMANGSPPGFWRSLLRGMFKAFPWCFITVITMELARDGRGLHDRLFGTYVIRVNAADVTRLEIASFIRETYDKNL